MRKIPTSCLMAGMIVGRSLYDRKNSLLLSKGHALSENEIIRIINLRYQAIYISDENDSDTEFLDNFEDICDALRQSAVCAIRDVFSLVSTERVISSRTIKNAKLTVNDIVNEIVLNKNVTFSMTDLKLFDDYTYFHSVNVTVIAVILGVALGLSKENLYKLGLGALMHDIGKIFVPKEILEKRGRLTPEEFEIIKSHSKMGYEYLRKANDFSDDSKLAVLTHHEKYGGHGYPDGIKENQIHLFGRILTVADVFDALVSDRPYRKAMLPSEAIEYIIGGSGDLFDPKIVNVFLEKISPYPVGTHVILSNGQKGIVVKNRPKFGLRPKVKIINDLGESVSYDLSRENFDITITGITYF